jgi:hypothetical protein
VQHTWPFGHIIELPPPIIERRPHVALIINGLLVASSPVELPSSPPSLFWAPLLDPDELQAAAAPKARKTKAPIENRRGDMGISVVWIAPTPVRRRRYLPIG